MAKGMTSKSMITLCGGGLKNSNFIDDSSSYGLYLVFIYIFYDLILEVKTGSFCQKYHKCY